MNIPEYLVYASKKYCNHKAITAAIEQSCDDVDVKYFEVNKVSSLRIVNCDVKFLILCQSAFIVEVYGGNAGNCTNPTWNDSCSAGDKWKPHKHSIHQKSTISSNECAW